MQEFDSGDYEIFQNPDHSLENNLVTNLIRQTIVNTDPLE